MGASKVSLKLLIDTKHQKVLFAEASKDFVDFLFHLLSLPLGTVIKLLTKKSMVGCLGNLYDSIENLSSTYIQSDMNKNSLLNPKVRMSSICATNIPLLPAEVMVAGRKLYMCPSYHRNVADDRNAICPHCENKMQNEVPYIAADYKSDESTKDEGGFAKGVVTYMVMDDLVVKPMSTISSITILNKFNIKEVGALEERIVDIGIDEGLKLLKASLESKTILTNVFLGNVST